MRESKYGSTARPLCCRLDPPPTVPLLPNPLPAPRLDMAAGRGIAALSLRYTAAP